MKRFLLALLALLLAGCASPKPTMMRVDADARDNWECIAQVESLLPQLGYALPDGRNRKFNDLYRQCMKARGYQEAAKP
jgi:type IV pilus biogenesis protein CpaD/CtpE